MEGGKNIIVRFPLNMFVLNTQQFFEARIDQVVTTSAVFEVNHGRSIMQDAGDGPGTLPYLAFQFLGITAQFVPGTF